MIINKTNRATLKSYFKKKLIPTEGQFAELIDGMINQKEDGIVKLEGNPLAIETSGADANNRKVLDLYNSFGDAVPEWSLALRQGGKTGLSIADKGGTSRLFIDDAGKVGVGTTQPAARLHVTGDMKVDGELRTDGLVVTSGKPVGGIPVLVLGILTFNNGGAAVASHTMNVEVKGFTFNSPLATGAVALQSYNVSAIGDNPMIQVLVEPIFDGIGADGKTVMVKLNVIGKSAASAAKYEYNVAVMVIGVAKGAL